ncbi:hypothetical protein EVAR_79657_1 [Eumeta japonica]|uniref:Uncharacterized protein n=1 Tax=Eumeta variegata TaxID=151549 RepID=A0A4C1W8W0_EUMVA|nr:hypothetical protein EVAR_79657_1 [Eumeta japonica]
MHTRMTALCWLTAPRSRACRTTWGHNHTELVQDSFGCFTGGCVNAVARPRPGPFINYGGRFNRSVIGAGASPARLTYRA